MSIGLHICLTAGNSPQLVAEQNLEACNPILRAVASAYMERAMGYQFEYRG